jgi:hypothetical protein
LKLFVSSVYQTTPDVALHLRVATIMYRYVDFIPIDYVNDFFHRRLELEAADSQPVVLGVSRSGFRDNLHK